MSHSIFISYSRSDFASMQEISSLLEREGMTVWTDEGIEPGTPQWKQTISEAIQQSENVIVLFSPDSAKSTWVNREIDFAELHNKKIFPFLLRGDRKDAIPFGFTTYQYIDARGEHSAREAAVHKLLGCIRENEKSEKAPNDPGCNPGQPEETAADIPETLWRWIDADGCSFTIPESWTVNPVNEETWRRAQLLLMGGDSYFYRWIQDEDLFLYKATGIPGAKMAPRFVFSDISGLTPLVGFVAVQSYPFPIPSWGAPLGFKLLSGRFDRYLAERFASTYSDRYWLKVPNGRILAMVSNASRDGHVYRGCSYMIFPKLSRHPINIHIGCEAERFDREQRQFDRIAQSFSMM